MTDDAPRPSDDSLWNSIKHGPDSAPSALPSSDTLAGRLIGATQRRGAPIASGPGEVNIIYVEGVDPDGTPNKNRPNAFDDCRFVVRFENGQPIIAGAWEATTQSGARYTQSPVNDHGAAIIALGYQKAWQVGMHRGNHEALVQTGGPVTVYRDADKNYSREGDRTETGWFGINQHWGYDQSQSDIGPASAGCLVGRSTEGHKQFMALVKADPRYQSDHAFVFGSTILTAADIGATQTAPPPQIETGYRSLIGGFFGDGEDTSLPASIRYNNPGAINTAQWIRQMPGYAGYHTIGGGNQIAVFYTPEQGVAVWWTLLKRYGENGASTVGAVINKYGGGQDYSEYLANIQQWTGLSGDTPIDLTDDAFLLKFGKAMFREEAGRATPLSDDQLKYGFALARGDDPAAQPTEDGDMPEDMQAWMNAMDERLNAVEAAVNELKAATGVPMPDTTQSQPQIDWGAVLQPVVKAVLPELIKALPQLLPLLLPLLPSLIGLLMGKSAPAPSNAPTASPMSPPGLGTILGGLVVSIFSAIASQHGLLTPDIGTAGIAAGGSAALVGGGQMAKASLTKK